MYKQPIFQQNVSIKQSWMDCIGDLDFQKSNQIQQSINSNRSEKLIKPTKYLFNTLLLQPKSEEQNICVDEGYCQKFNQIQFHKYQRSKPVISGHQTQLLSCKNKKIAPNQDQDYQDQNYKNSQQQQTQFNQKKNTRLEKGHIYSKNYRQKKKEKFNILKEQNSILKTKISYLEKCFIEKQDEISFLKHSIQQKAIQQLNYNKRVMMEFRQNLKYFDANNKFYHQFNFLQENFNQELQQSQQSQVFQPTTQPKNSIYKQNYLCKQTQGVYKSLLRNLSEKNFQRFASKFQSMLQGKLSQKINLFQKKVDNRVQAREKSVSQSFNLQISSANCEQIENAKKQIIQQLQMKTIQQLEIKYQRKHSKGRKKVKLNRTNSNSTQNTEQQLGTLLN